MSPLSSPVAVIHHADGYRLFYSWDSQSVGTLSLQDVVEGLDRVMGAGLMESIEWFFNLVSHPSLQAETRQWANGSAR